MGWKTGSGTGCPRPLGSRFRAKGGRVEKEAEKKLRKKKPNKQPNNTRQESNKTMFINKNKEIGFVFIKPSGQGRARA